jgi:hypothetical protein
MLVISGMAIYNFKKTSIDASNEFPEVNCKQISERMGDHFIEFAGREYERWKEYPEE